MENKRLTKKVGDNYCSQNGDFYDLYNKLGKLEDLEEQLECPLDVVFKAVINGLWHITPDDNIVFRNNRDYVITLRGYVDSEPTIMVRRRYTDEYDVNLLLEDYKKTWWLKEDRSE